MAKIEIVTKYLDLFSAAFFGKEISEKTIAVYVKYCSEIPDEQFILACDVCIKQCRFFPTIAEIFEKATLFTQTEKEREIENEKIKVEIEKTAKKLFGGSNGN